MNDPPIGPLVELFQETGRAHDEAFRQSRGVDPEWPLWWSEKMHAALKALLGATFTRSELVYLLVSAENERRQTAPGSDWATFYARFFAERFG